jgi:phosphatidylglycerol:prolipoprotein diacylglycerol transferase
MHPVLFTLPLPSFAIPLGLTLGLLAVALVVAALLGWRKRVWDVVIAGAAAALVSAAFAVAFRGKTYTMTALPIYSYGALLCASLVIGWHLMLRLAQRDGLSRVEVANCYFWTAVGALIGARLLYVVTNLNDFRSYFSAFDFRGGGLVAYGGFLGGLAASALYLRKARTPLLEWADVAVPSVAAGVALTRVGCYLFGCDFGTPLPHSAPSWLARLGTFPRWSHDTLPDVAGSPAWVQHVHERGLSFDSAASLPVHPTQLYESLLGVALLLVALGLRRRRTFAGQTFLVVAFGYALFRFLLETLRDDLERGSFGPYVPENVLVLLGVLAFAAAYGYGPARQIRDLRVRVASMVVLPALAITAFFMLEPPPATLAEQLSTSQWLALITGMAAAAAWSPLRLRAKRESALPAEVAAPPL